MCSYHVTCINSMNLPYEEETSEKIKICAALLKINCFERHWKMSRPCQTFSKISCVHSDYLWFLNEKCQSLALGYIRV